MSFVSRRVLTGFKTSQYQSLSTGTRYKSTTSAIKSGLQAERGTSSRDGRVSSSGPRRSFDRDTTRPSSIRGDSRSSPSRSGASRFDESARSSSIRSRGTSTSPRDDNDRQGSRAGELRSRSSERTSSRLDAGRRSSGESKTESSFGQRNSDSGRPTRFADGSSSIGRSGRASEQSSRFADRPQRSGRPERASEKPSRFAERSTSFGDRESSLGRSTRFAGRSTSFDKPERSSNYSRSPREGSFERSDASRFDRSSDSRRSETLSDETISRQERRAQYWSEKATDDELNLPRLKAHQMVDRPRRPADTEDVPVTIPYTTASSQWVYGANSVFAALTAGRRKIYQLIMHKRAEAENIAQIRRTATAMGIEIMRTADTALLDKLSEGRPHNGVVLETSSIPARPVLSLERYNAKYGQYKLELEKQSAEEAAVNGTENKMRYGHAHRPLIIFLDGITDPGNVGNIIRTAHFFGADAVAIATQTCATLSSAILAKASAGACEAIPIFAINHASGFIYNSRKNGWTICAAVAPAALQSDPQKETRQHLTTRDMLLNAPFASKPCILMLGAEGEGLRENLTKKADVFLTIAQTSSSRDAGVESLNVASAAALLIDSFSAKDVANNESRKKSKVDATVASGPSTKSTALTDSSTTPIASTDPPTSSIVQVNPSMASTAQIDSTTTSHDTNSTEAAEAEADSSSLSKVSSQAEESILLDESTPEGVDSTSKIEITPEHAKSISTTETSPEGEDALPTERPVEAADSSLLEEVSPEAGHSTSVEEASSEVVISPPLQETSSEGGEKTNEAQIVDV